MKLKNTTSIFGKTTTVYPDIFYLNGVDLRIIFSWLLGNQRATHKGKQADVNTHHVLDAGHPDVLQRRLALGRRNTKTDTL